MRVPAGTVCANADIPRASRKTIVFPNLLSMISPQLPIARV
jgi:hypothetical protein